jgi:hypothetical protein
MKKQTVKRAIKVCTFAGTDPSLRSLLKVAIIPTFKGTVVQVRIFKLKRAKMPFSAGSISWKCPLCHFQPEKPKIKGIFNN